MTTTTNLGILLPTPGVTTNWGQGATAGGLNFVLQKIDDVFAADASGTPVGLFVDRDSATPTPNPQTLKIGSYGTFSSQGTNIFGLDGSSGGVLGNTIRAGNAIAGSNNTAGGNLTIAGGNSTGTAAGGSILMQVAAAGTISSDTLNTLRNVLRVESTNRVGVNTGSTAPAVTLDVGAGGSSGSATAQQALRLNGSSAGNGTQGGSLFTIANNGTNTGAVGNYSAVMGGSTTYAADTTVASASTLRFFTNATIAGATASNERLRLGTAGEIGVWDAGTSAINNGTAGQVLVSGGTGAAASWGTSTKTLVAPGTSPGTGITYTITNSTITAPFKVLELYLNGVSSNSTSNLSIQISGDGTTYTTLFVIGSTTASSSGISGVVKIVGADTLTGTRLISATTNQLASGAASIYSQTAVVDTGYVKYIRLDWNGSDVFDAGTVALVGYA
jgi:hypothetical protein